MRGGLIRCRDGSGGVGFGARTLFRAVAIACVTAVAATAHADEGAAKKLFEDGAKAFARGDFVVAAKAFEGANREAPSGAALHNAGLAWDAAAAAAHAASPLLTNPYGKKK